MDDYQVRHLQLIEWEQQKQEKFRISLLKMFLRFTYVLFWLTKGCFIKQVTAFKTGLDHVRIMEEQIEWYLGDKSSSK